jgi:hypothetical protein
MRGRYSLLSRASHGLGARHRGDCGGQNRCRACLNGPIDLSDSASPVTSLRPHRRPPCPSGLPLCPRQPFTTLVGDSPRYSPTQCGSTEPPTLRDALAPLRRYGHPPAPTPAGNCPPRASHFPGGQRTTVGGGMQIGRAPALSRPESHLQIIWVNPDVCRLLANNLGCWQINVGSKPRILSVNLGRKSRCLQAEAPMFAGRYK